ncbi:Flavocytochrome c [Roridomyces roridus]|uniref:Fumarate reductase n=1 Tax=Roridomyces roridus TaxID=1738132 RepID=A0AAD7FDF8_9AGAR|nr:Flavocytochrome c [Roridomyces roridus]
MAFPRTIVVGGGLAGLSATHTLLERGKSVLLLDKKPSLGGNSVKASSGINGAHTAAQQALGIQDSVEAYYTDTAASAGTDLARPKLITALTSNSASALSWLTNDFGVDLSIVSRLGGHSAARTHRDKSGAPGWAITAALMKKLTALAETDGARVEVIKGARVVKLLEEEGAVVGVEYETGASTQTARGNVILATGCASFSLCTVSLKQKPAVATQQTFSATGLLATHRPDLLSLSTTNGDHATGDGVRLATSLTSLAPAALCDLDQVQVHPTGFVDPANPAAKTKFLAAEALRGVGGLLIDGKGVRFVDEVQRRDVVTKAMQKVEGGEGRGPVRLVLSEEAVGEVKKHCDFYVSKNLMKRYSDAKEFSADTGIPLEAIVETFASHGKYASGGEVDPFGKKTFHNATYNPDTPLHVAIITPVVHYTMGGLSIDSSGHVLSSSSAPIPGLFAAGEVIGGVHGQNRLAGSSLLEAVVFGRIAGTSAAE